MINVPANDLGAIYVLELNRPAPDGLDDKTDAAMMAVFGNIVLNTDYVDAITPGLLVDMSLPDFIRNGYDMPVSDIQAENLRRLIGTVVLVMSAAFRDSAINIDLPSDVRLVMVCAKHRPWQRLARSQPIARLARCRRSGKSRPTRPCPVASQLMRC